MSDQSESLGGAVRVLQQCLQFYMQFKMMKSFSAARNKKRSRDQGELDQDKLKDMMNNFDHYRVNVGSQIYRNAPFQFTGGKGDFAYFMQENALSKNVINELPNNLSKDVMNNFTQFCKDGLLNYNSESGLYTLTSKGYEKLISEDFVTRTANEHLLKDFEFTGQVSDLSAFDRVEHINLNWIQEKYPQNSKEIISQFKNFQRNKVCNIHNGIAEITSTGRQFIHSHTYLTFINKGAGETVTGAATTATGTTTTATTGAAAATTGATATTATTGAAAATAGATATTAAAGAAAAGGTAAAGPIGGAAAAVGVKTAQLTLGLGN